MIQILGFLGLLIDRMVGLRLLLRGLVVNLDRLLECFVVLRKLLGLHRRGFLCVFLFDLCFRLGVVLPVLVTEILCFLLVLL